jgi:hypothetical protein
MFTNLTSGENLGYLENLKRVLESIYENVLSKSFILSVISEHDATNYSGVLPLSIWVAVYVIVASSLVKQARRNGAYLVILSVPIFAIILFPLINGLYKPWHVYQLSPLIVVPFGLLTLRGDMQTSFVQRYLQNYVLIALAIVSFLNSTWLAMGTVNRTRVHPYDGSLFSVADWIKENHTTPNLICLDYSVCHNLLFMLGQDYKLLLETAFTPEQEIYSKLEDLKQFDYYLIAHVKRKFPSKKSVADDLLYSRSSYFLGHPDFPSTGLAEQFSSNSDPKYVIYYHKPSS